MIEMSSTFLTNMTQLLIINIVVDRERDISHEGVTTNKKEACMWMI
jgi:hypothetical protein